MLKEECENIRAAVEQGRTDIIRSVLDACDPETKERILNEPLVEEGTFLYLATKLNQGDVVRTLLSCGADPGVQNSCRLNPVDTATTPQMHQIYVEELLRATANSEVGRVCQLIAAGISINAWDSEASQNTPLHWAACYGKKDIVMCLIDRGADVNAMNSCGATPLHDAVFQGDLEVVRALLHSGAHPLIQALKGKFGGKTPLDLASHNPKLRILLEGFTSSVCPSTNNNEHLNHNSDNVSVHNDHVGHHTDSRIRSTSVESFNSGIGDHGHETVTFQERMSAHSAVMYSSQCSSLDLSPRIDQAIESLVRTHIRTPIRPLVTHSSLHLLWPQPQRIEELEGPPFVPQKELNISVIQGQASIHRILDVWDISRPALLALGYDVKVSDGQPYRDGWSDSQIECSINERLSSTKDAYQIHINSERVRICAESLAGLHYAVCTFTQLLRLSSELVPVLIEDHPTLHHRGVLLDISPLGRIPTMEYLFHMISLWSSMKASHLHLYTRLVRSTDWQLCFSSRKMITIDRYCQDRFISLLPVLDVDPQVTFHDLADMWPIFREVVANFPNLSCVHIGPKLSSLLLRSGDGGSEEEVGIPLQELWHLLDAAPTVTILLCSNSVQLQQQHSIRLPANMVLMQYGFQADYDFLEWTQEFRRQGGMTCLCPGTASWNSLAGCPEASVCNIYRAVQVAVEQRSLGVVVAHWSGSYHLTPHPFSWPGFVVGCGLAWNPSTHWDYLHNSLPELLNTHIFLDNRRVVGRVIIELGYAETFVLRSSRNQDQGDLSDLPAQDGSCLYKLLTDPDNVSLENLSIDIFARVSKHIKKCQTNLLQVEMESPFAEMVIQELQLSADLMLTAVRIGRTLITVGTNPNSNMGLAVINLGVCHLPPTFRTDIANKLLALIEQYKGTWLQRHLPAGLQNSLLVLTSVLHRFVPNDSNGT
ncbi:uncharacterized protein [Anabrus simplex]|uniref:uncharacterized protein n=1 Tax=Anabrus simplex TaxID=316456 RepID=UPI0034DD2A50